MVSRNVPLTTGPILAVLIMLSSGLIFPATGSSRTGQLDNQPVTGFSEGDTVIELIDDAGNHTTEFAINGNLTVRLASVAVGSLGPPKDNRLRIFNNTGAIVLERQGFLAQTQGTPPYRYTGTVQLTSATFTDDHYLVELWVKEPNGGGGDIVGFGDVIAVATGGAPAKSITFYSDAGYTMAASSFLETATVYVQIYSGGPADNVTSDLLFANYLGAPRRIPIANLANGAIQNTGPYSRFAVNLALDSPEPLNHGWWYGLGADLRDSAGGPLTRNWMGQFMARKPPSAASSISAMSWKRFFTSLLKGSRKKMNRSKSENGWKA